MSFQTLFWSCPAAFVRVFVKQALTKVWKRRWRGRADWINTMQTVIESGSLVVWGGTSFSSSFCFPAKEETATFLTLPCPWGPAEPPRGRFTEGTTGGRAAATNSFTLMGVPLLQKVIRMALVGGKEWEWLTVINRVERDRLYHAMLLC